jgi:hypothetical protein
MTNRELFKLWAPREAKWTDWVRPVLFATMDNSEQRQTYHQFQIPNIFYLNTNRTDTAIILDLPGYSSIEEGLALAMKGYRPIPLYNGTMEQQGAMATVDHHGIQSALRWGASEIKKMQLKGDAPPVFLLDSNRMLRLKMTDAMFDNSWDLYAQDLPSAEYFQKNNINRIVIRGERIQKDLAKILYKFQLKGITILFTNGYEEAQSVKIKKPSLKEKFDNAFQK